MQIIEGGVTAAKGFVNYQIDKGVIPPIDLKHFKVVEEETDAIYLSEKELSTIHELDLSDDKQLEEIRDVFITGCFTGLRYSDLSTLSPEHIDLDNEIINLKQRKVHKAVIIPMIDYVPEILKKYNYDLPKIPRYIFNERVKELGRRAKLKQKIEVVRKKGKEREKRMTIGGVLKSAFDPLLQKEQRMNEICDQLGDANPEQMEQLMEELGTIQDELTLHDFYTIDAKVEEVARALGLLDLGLERDVTDLSGGQRTKVLLAKLLLEKPDILLLDEPTNYLDEEHIAWLKRL